jgi:hypothetical protein
MEAKAISNVRGNSTTIPIAPHKRCRLTALPHGHIARLHEIAGRRTITDEIFAWQAQKSGHGFAATHFARNK